MSFPRTLGSLLITLLLLAACGDDGNDRDDRTAGPLPFDAVLIELFGTDDTDAYLATAERAAAELVVTCMNEAGFEFQIPPTAATADGGDPTDVATASIDGFGIISGFRAQLSELDVPGTERDPNLEFLSRLSSTEIERFFFTLDGVEPEPGQRATGGCNGQASDQAYAGWLRFVEALPNYTVLGEERDTHPDWLSARAEWRACMIERGFDYAEPDAIRTDVISRMRDTVNESYPGGQVPLVETDGVYTVDPQVDELLEDLAQFERDAAVANIECTEPLAERFHEVERRVQADFVARNQAAIDDLLAAN